MLLLAKAFGFSSGGFCFWKTLTASAIRHPAAGKCEGMERKRRI
jgi:hypothetical protein